MAIQRLSNAGQSGYRYKSLIAGITPVASVPTIGAATALTFSTASVAFTAPGAYAATTFTATSSPGGLTGTSASSPITVSGLSENTAYTFTVTATNATGTSSPSAASSSITTPTAFTPESGYDSLATVTLSASTATITFAGIPSGYKHLQIRAMTKSTSSQDSIDLTFNADTSNSYSYHSMYGNGSSTGSEAIASRANIPTTLAAVSSANTSIFATGVIDILDYSSLSKNKTVRTLTGFDTNGAGTVYLSSGAWISTSAISSLTLTCRTYNFAVYSSFALYGVK